MYNEAAQAIEASLNASTEICHQDNKMLTGMETDAKETSATLKKLLKQYNDCTEKAKKGGDAPTGLRFKADPTKCRLIKRKMQKFETKNALFIQVTGSANEPPPSSEDDDQHTKCLTKAAATSKKALHAAKRARQSAEEDAKATFNEAMGRVANATKSEQAKLAPLLKAYEEAKAVFDERSLNATKAKSKHTAATKSLQDVVADAARERSVEIAHAEKARDANSRRAVTFMDDAKTAANERLKTGLEQVDGSCAQEQQVLAQELAMIEKMKARMQEVKVANPTTVKPVVMDGEKPVVMDGQKPVVMDGQKPIKPMPPKTPVSTARPTTKPEPVVMDGEKPIKPPMPVVMDGKKPIKPPINAINV